MPREEVAIRDGSGRGQVKCFVWRIRSVREGRGVGVEGMEEEADDVDIGWMKRRRGAEAFIT